MKNKQGLTIAALIIAIVGLSIGFAAFSNTLTISQSATVNPSDANFIVQFSKVSDADQTGSSYQIVPDSETYGDRATINSSNKKLLEGVHAKFTAPNQSVTYTLYVRNTGQYVAYLKELAFANAANATSGETYKHCYAATTNSNNQALTAAEQATPSLVSAACEGIDISVTIGTAGPITPASQSKSLNNQALSANGGNVLVTITITYANNAAYVDGPMEVEFGTISFTASSNQGSSQGSQEQGGQEEQGGGQEPSQVTSLVPTEQEISEFDYYEEKDIYYIAQSHNNDDDFIQYAIEDGHNFINAELDSSGIVLMYAFDSDGAAYLTGEWEQTINQNTWYQVGENGLEEYTGSDPISSLFTSNDIFSTSYFNKLVASF